MKGSKQVIIIYIVIRNTYIICRNVVAGPKKGQKNNRGGLSVTLFLCRVQNVATFAPFSRGIQWLALSKPQNPRSKIRKRKIVTPKSKNQDPKSKIQNPKSGPVGPHKKNCYITVQNPKSKIQASKSGQKVWIWDFGLENFGFGIADFGCWIPDCGFGGRRCHQLGTTPCSPRAPHNWLGTTPRSLLQAVSPAVLAPPRARFPDSVHKWPNNTTPCSLPMPCHPLCSAPAVLASQPYQI